jgi:ubiquinone/menaquinone biosynthesis C-methylase UbiE
MTKINKMAWDEVFKKEGKVRSQIQEDMPKIVKMFKKHKVENVLDLGCGSGRHLVFLAKNGFDVYGIDIAKHGIKISKKWLKAENLKAKLKFADMYKKLPYKSNFFDAIVSTQTLHHSKIEDIRNLIKEMERILKPRGLIFVTVLKPFPRKQITLIAPRTYIKVGYYDKEMPHYKFNKNILKKEFKNFKTLDLWVEKSKRHYCLLGQLKKNE